MLLFKVKHITKYQYNDTISLCHNVALLQPRETPGQKVISFKLSVSPQPECIQQFEDYFGNHADYFAIQSDHKDLLVETVSEISVDESFCAKAIFENFDSTASWETARDQIKQQATKYFDVIEFLQTTPVTQYNQAIIDFVDPVFFPGKPLKAALYDLMEKIYNEISFKSGFTTIQTPATETIKNKKGVCQDLAHLGIACSRALGLPSRYVSGYIETASPEGKEKLIGVDASHAWYSVFVPGCGWIDFDPTNCTLTSSQHITIGWGRDYFDITPLKGVIFSTGTHLLSVSVDVQRIL